MHHLPFMALCFETEQVGTLSEEVLVENEPVCACRVLDIFCLKPRTPFRQNRSSGFFLRHRYYSPIPPLEQFPPIYLLRIAWVQDLKPLRLWTIRIFQPFCYNAF
jgi:hypothetical protein